MASLHYMSAGSPSSTCSSSPERIQDRGRRRGSSPERIQDRGRRRGRPSKRRAGGSRGRGTNTRRQTSNPPWQGEAMEDRMVHAKERIGELPAERVRELLVTVLERHPSLILDILDVADPQGGYHPPPESPFPDWCRCSHCRQMPTQAEMVCCRRTPGNCTSNLPEMKMLVLNEAVLAIARLYRQDVLAVDDEPDYNRANRFAAYRQYTLWAHGRLGQAIRKAIPSCCVWRIRDKFPDAFGQYLGFIPSRIG